MKTTKTVTAIGFVMLTLCGAFAAGTDKTLVSWGCLANTTQQGASAAESADAKTLIQMAIVYKGNQISLYRNGQPYASYEAGNIDLLAAKDNQAVFGLRHCKRRSKSAAGVRCLTGRGLARGGTFKHGEECMLLWNNGPRSEDECWWKE